MTLHELMLLAEQGPHLYLVVPRKTLPEGNTIRLAGRRGPQGKICNVKKAEDGYDVLAVFGTKKILDFIRREGLK